MVAKTAKKTKAKKEDEKKGSKQAMELMPKTDVDLLVRLRARALQIGEFERIETKTKEKHAKAKAELTEARSEIIDLVRLQNEEPPFGGRTEEDGWKRVPLKDVIGAKLATKVFEGANGVIKGDTLGALTVFLKDRSLTELKGVGPGVSGKIADKMEDFWRVNKQWTNGKVAKGSI